MSVKCLKCNLVWNNLKIDYDSDEGDGVCPRCCSSLDLVSSEENGYIYNPMIGIFKNDTTPKRVFLIKKIPEKTKSKTPSLTWEEKQKIRTDKEDAAILAYISSTDSTDYFNTIKI